MSFTTNGDLPCTIMYSCGSSSRETDHPVGVSPELFQGVLCSGLLVHSMCFRDRELNYDNDPM